MAKAALTSPHPRRTALRIFAAILTFAVILVLWRGGTLATHAWQANASAQRLRSAAQANAFSTHLPQIAADLDQLAANLSALAAELQPFAPLFGDRAAAITAAADLAGTAAAMAPHLDWLLGLDAARTYLLVVQNNHELRATGGFISALGTLVVDNGKLAELTFADSYAFYNPAHEYGPAPAPMQQYMGIQLLVARDANWSPDLPTAAQTIRTLYTQATGRSVDGILTLDLHAVRHLIAALGTLHAEGVATPITAANLEQVLIDLWDHPPDPSGADAAAGPAGPDWWSHRKDFVPLIAAGALARLQAGSVDPLALAAELAAALDDRSLQLWLAAPSVQAEIAARGWDGALHPPPDGDFLAIVDSNVGYNKVDAVLRREAAYSVAWEGGASAPATATLTLTYTHPISAAAAPLCDPSPRYGAAYADLIARCYFDYLRVYVPGGSRLIDISGLDPQTVTSAPGEAGTQVFGAYLIVPPGASKSVTFTYQLPPARKPGSYRLHVQRQAGTDPLPLAITAADENHQTTIAAGVWIWSPTIYPRR